MNLISESRNFVKLKERRVQFIGQILRHNEYMTNIIEVKVLDKRKRKAKETVTSEYQRMYGNQSVLCTEESGFR